MDDPGSAHKADRDPSTKQHLLTGILSGYLSRMRAASAWRFSADHAKILQPTSPMADQSQMLMNTLICSPHGSHLCHTSLAGKAHQADAPP